MATKKSKPANYEHLVKGSDMASDEYAPDSTVSFSADKPVSGANRYVGPNASKAGAGRGKQGGPTAKELQRYEEKQDAGIFTKGKRMPPSPREMASGGKVASASKRADGCATQGKTRGKFV
jgi:hypothetical protein